MSQYLRSVNYTPLSIPDLQVEFLYGNLSLQDIISDINILNSQSIATSFEPIGMGKPLTIEIRHVYTGKYPEGNFFGRRKDMLLTSAIRSTSIFNEAPRAINFLDKNIEKNHNKKYFHATEKGTPLVYYSPALTERNSVLTFEFGFDEFPEELFETFSSAFVSATSLPLFISAGHTGLYLLAAGTLIKLIGTLSRNIFKRSPVFKGTVELPFERPGSIPPIADYRIITDTELESDLLAKYKLKDSQLVDDGGNPYSGDIPYIVISLDGRKNDEYKDFIPTATTAIILDNFYNINNNQRQSLEILQESLKLYNDFQFRLKANEIAKDLEELKKNPNSAEYKKKKALYDAQVANIMQDLFKPRTELP